MKFSQFSSGVIAIAAIFSLGFVWSNVDEHQKVIYVSHSSILGDVSEGPGNNSVLHNEVMSSDDSPFERLILPFEVVLFGKKVRQLFLNPNGGLHYSFAQPYPLYNIFGIGNTERPFNATYYGVIGGLLTDLDPSKSPNCSISSDNFGDHLTVMYHNVRYYGNPNGTNSFRIQLFRDSHIEIKYDHIFRTNNNFPMLNQYSSGLRSLQNDLYTQYSHAQIALGKTEWNTDIPGVYPTVQEVRSGRQFTMCPISRTWCMQPGTLFVNTTDSVSNGNFSLTLTTLLLSCLDTIQYGLQMTSNSSLHSGMTPMTINCTVSPTSSHLQTPMVSLVCPLRLNVTNIAVSAVARFTFRVELVWRVTADHSSVFTPLDVDPLVLIMETNSSSPSDQCAYNLSSSTAHCDSCDICNGDVTCLDLPCTLNGTQSELFEVPSCNGSCPVSLLPGNLYLESASIDTILTNETFYTDFKGHCCALGQMDCAGTCFGDNVVAISTEYSRTCCNVTIDCLGMCGGKSQYDMCGVCGGRDLTGSTCFNASLIVVDTGYADLSFHPLFDLSGVSLLPEVNSDPSDSSHLKHKLVIHVNNTSPKNITVYFPTQNSLWFAAPTLSLPSETTLFHLPHNTSLSIPFTVSLYPLFIGNMSQFTPKTIILKYYRDEYTNPQGRYTVKLTVYPATTGCSVLNNANGRKEDFVAYDTRNAAGACVRMPGCMFCMSNDYARVLRAVSGSDVNDMQTDTVYLEGENEEEEEIIEESDKLQWHRRLFTYLIPDMTTNTDKHLYQGRCVEGWSAQVCKEVNGMHRSNSATSSFGVKVGRMKIMMWNLGVVLLCSAVVHLYI